jgi:NADH dehydrogenase/NADH:ubiquinone oxidoreductase subunit G
MTAEAAGRPAHVTIDGQHLEVPEGTLLLHAAAAAGVEIPTLCYHPNLTANAICRMCVVEPSRGRTLIPACAVGCFDGLEVNTDSPRVQRARKVILELLHSAADCSEAPAIQAYSERYGADPARFTGDARRTVAVKDDNPFYVRDYDKCILCWRCVQVCAEDVQFTYALTLGERGFHTHIATFFDAPMPDTTCVFCGNCVEVCPSGALKGKQEWLMEQGLSPDDIRQQTRRTRRLALATSPTSPARPK